MSLRLTAAATFPQPKVLSATVPPCPIWTTPASVASASMKTRGSESLLPNRRSIRRFTFMTLLLLAVAAPAGLVFAGERKSPYIVVFKDEAVTQAVADTGTYFVRSLAPRAEFSDRLEAPGQWHTCSQGRIRASRANSIGRRQRLCQRPWRFLREPDQGPAARAASATRPWLPSCPTRK